MSLMRYLIEQFRAGPDGRYCMTCLARGAGENPTAVAAEIANIDHLVTEGHQEQGEDLADAGIVLDDENSDGAYPGRQEVHEVCQVMSRMPAETS